MHVGVVGINHKQADLRLREEVAKTLQRHYGAPAEGFVCLSTCNRTEVYFGSGELTEIHHEVLALLPEGAHQRVYTFFGTDCFEHLARVTSGLDSAMVGETEIQGQVKQAYELARQTALPSDLHFLFQKCLRIGKRVRTALPIKPGMPDTESAILEVGRELFGDLSSRRVLFVGASEINSKVLRRFKERGIEQITLINRSDEGARRLAKGQNVAIRPWHAVDEWHTYDLVVLGTKYPGYLIEEAPPSISPTLLIDLAVPRNANPLLSDHSEVVLRNIDDLHGSVEKSRRLQADILSQLDQMVSESVDRLTLRTSRSLPR